MHTDICDNTRREKCLAKGSRREVKIQVFMYRDTTNVEPEIYDCTSNNWSHWSSNKRFKGKFGSHTRKKDSVLVESQQKTAVLGTAQRIREVLQSET